MTSTSSPVNLRLSPPLGVGRVFGLDALRAVAILSVLFSHAFPAIYPHTKYLGLLGHGGFYGVELFFVLSGFLIGQILIRQDIALGESSTLAAFYVRRWFRTLPLFWLFFWINLYLWGGRQMSVSEIAEHAFFLRTFSGNYSIFFLEAWSLAVEEWFYLLFPLVLYLGLRCYKHFDRVFLLVSLAFYLFSTIGRVLSVSNPHASWAAWQRMIVIYRFDAIMIGVVAAWIATRCAHAWSRYARWCAICGALLLIVMYLDLWRIRGGIVIGAPNSFFAQTFRFNLISLGFALLLPVCSTWILGQETLASICIRRIALWSYAIYIAQTPVILFIQKYLFLRWQSVAWQGISLFCLQVGATIAISALLFHYYERPLTQLREKAAPAVADIFRRVSAIARS